jgi:hypothetical protein
MSTSDPSSASGTPSASDPSAPSGSATPARRSTATVTPEVAVPEDESPGARCGYCDRPFDTEHARDLHVGDVHDDVVTDAEAEAYEEAMERENDDLFLYHIKVIVALGIIHGVVVLAYMAVLG